MDRFIGHVNWRVGGGQWKRVQEGLHGARRILPGRDVWDSSKCSLRQSEAKALIGKEEESFIFENRAAECSSKIILAFFSLGQGRIVLKPIEPVRGIQHVISKIVKDRAVKLV